MSERCGSNPDRVTRIALCELIILRQSLFCAKQAGLFVGDIPELAPKPEKLPKRFRNHAQFSAIRQAGNAGRAAAVISGCQTTPISRV